MRKKFDIGSFRREVVKAMEIPESELTKKIRAILENAPAEESIDPTRREDVISAYIYQYRDCWKTIFRSCKDDRPTEIGVYILSYRPSYPDLDSSLKFMLRTFRIMERDDLAQKFIPLANKLMNIAL